MQFLKQLASRFKNKPQAINPSDLPEDQRRGVLRDLESIRTYATALRVYLRKIDQAQANGTRLNPLIRVKADRLQGKMAALIEVLYGKGIPMAMIESYVERGED